jgi:mono/diheme cytochrome c family protein
MKNYRKFIWLVPIGVLLLALVACGGGGDTAGSSGSSSSASESASLGGDASHGEELFNQTCIACHGAGGIGIENLGKNMVTSEFIRGKTDADLRDFIKTGRPIGDPDNTTGVDMPPKGGNPALSDEDLADIIAYIRTLQK